MKHAWIQEHRDQLPVTVMCRLLGVSTSGFYGSQRAKPSERVARSQRIRDQVKRLYQQYTSDLYQKTLSALGMTCSMSHTGCCYDNAVMERFFWSLKQEWTNHRNYTDLQEAKLSVFQYIHTFYNSHRIHQTLGYRTPDQVEEQFQQNLAA